MGEGDAADAERRFIVVNKTVAAEHGYNRHIKVRIIKVPEMRVSEAENSLSLTGGLSRKPDASEITSDQATARSAVSLTGMDGDLIGKGGCGLSVVLKVDIHTDLGRLLRDARGGDKDTPLGDVLLRTGEQTHMAVDARAGIPAGAPGFGVQADGHDIIAAPVHKGGEVYPERGIAIRMAAGLVAVDPHFGVGHRSVEIQIGPLSLLRGRQRELLAVPADAAPGQFAGQTVEILAEGAFDAPVVRQVQRAPAAVVVGGVGRSGRRFGQRAAVGLQAEAGKAPVAVERLRAARNLRMVYPVSMFGLLVRQSQGGCHREAEGHHHP